MQNPFTVQEPGVSSYVQDNATSASEQAGQYTTALYAAPEVNYMSHLLEAGFDPQDIPNSLY